MSLIYVHLSDIHFGQENGGQRTVNNDVKEQLITDVKQLLTKLSVKSANGIIISGDIAYAGKKEEYESAGQWLDKLTEAAGCDQTSVQMVPGNHDIDRSFISSGTQTLVDLIARNGDSELDKYLTSDQDRELLYKKFSAYQTFAAGYRCPLDPEGSVQGHTVVKIADNKFIKFYGVNTALICSNSKTEEGSLLLGQRQRVIVNGENTETIVIAHHPLHWLQDSQDALLYIKNRARVFISGHEHKPIHRLEELNQSSSLLSIASGATMPPDVDKDFTYCYNILEFSWDEILNVLKVIIHPRIWDNEHKCFIEDNINFNLAECTFMLKCPNFTRQNENIINKAENIPPPGPAAVVVKEIPKEGGNDMDDKEESKIVLHFFRELSSNQRIQLLIELNALPSDYDEPITHSIETLALKFLFNNGRAKELKDAIETILSPNK